MVGSNIDDFSFGKLIGFFEGEGWISFTNFRSVWNFGIGNTNKKLLEEMRESVFKIIGIRPTIYGPDIGKYRHKPLYQLRIEGSRIVPLLIALLPYLDEKRQKAIEAINYYKLHPERKSRGPRGPYKKRVSMVGVVSV